MRSVAIAAALAACGPRATLGPPAFADAGISLALYANGEVRYGVVDDRRWVDIRGREILLDNIDPGAALASLVIEPRDAGVHIGPCTRERLPDAPPRDVLQEFGEEQDRKAEERMRLRLRRHIAPNIDRVVDPPPEPDRKPSGPRFAPIVRCTTTAPPGRHLVRIVYVSTSLRYRAQHDIEMRESTRAELSSRFAVVTPPWRQRARIVLYDGAPGTTRAPREIARGDITLDGGTSVLVVAPRLVDATLRRVFEGARVADDESETDDDEPAPSHWDLADIPVVWATLELAVPNLASGPIRVHIELPGEEPRWIDIAVAMQRARAEGEERSPRSVRALRIPLWVDDTLHAIRERNIVENDGARTVELFTHGITNIGGQPREVWIEETLRSARRRRLERAWPKRPIAVSPDVLRHVIEVQPGKTLRVGYVVSYDE